MKIVKSVACFFSPEIDMHLLYIYIFIHITYRLNALGYKNSFCLLMLLLTKCSMVFTCFCNVYENKLAITYAFATERTGKNSIKRHRDWCWIVEYTHNSSSTCIKWNVSFVCKARAFSTAGRLRTSHWASRASITNPYKFNQLEHRPRLSAFLIRMAWFGTKSRIFCVHSRAPYWFSRIIQWI